MEFVSKWVDNIARQTGNAWNQKLCPFGHCRKGLFGKKVQMHVYVTVIMTKVE